MEPEARAYRAMVAKLARGAFERQPGKQAMWPVPVVGVLTAATVWWAWGSLTAPPVAHDEAAYLLQARLFASGRWTAPAPPYPEFFEQYHVLVTPALASKYFPGHSLAMAPGVWIGLPGLMPVVLSGLSGALMFALARVTAGTLVAVLTWLLWLASPLTLRWHAGYFSQNTSTALILGAWTLLAVWLSRRTPGPLVGAAVLLGCAAITRPLTALAFSVPVGVVVLYHCVRRRAWTQLGAAFLAGSLCLGVIPLWSQQTTGDWRLTPHALYTSQYMPWDRVGFRFDDTPPGRELPPEMESFAQRFHADYAGHTVASLPGQLRQRAGHLLAGSFEGWATPFLPLVAVAVLFLPAYGWFAAASLVTVLMAHLVYAHRPYWTLYYMEIAPTIAFLGALGAWRLVRWVALRTPIGPRTGEWSAFALLCGLVLLQLPATALAARSFSQGEQSYPRRLEAALGRIPQDEAAVVFIRLGPDHSPHLNAVFNTDDPARLRILLARDRGEHNQVLTATMPGRRAYLWDETGQELTRLIE